MNNNKNYFEYLKGRSRLGLIYRRFFLYQKIARQLKKGSVLDYGCGIGDFLQFYKDAVGADIDSELVDFCNSKGLNTVLIQNNKVPFDDHSFDSIILDNVLEHIENPNNLIKEIYRLIKFNGVLIVGVPGLKGFEHDEDHKVFYDNTRLSGLFERYSFTVEGYFYTPFKSVFLNKYMRQYCLYMIFKPVK